jgi:valyl-tRNA synthetase
MKQEEAGSGEAGFEAGLAERWIARRFDQALVAAEHALQSYKLHDYSKKLYEFIWNDFCDWYVEVFKVQFNQESDAARRRGLVSFALSIFERVMRLLHPVMPYITEELWHAVSGATDEETIAKQLMPKPIGFESGAAGEGVEYSEADEKHFARMVGMIEEIRALRGQFAIAPHIEIPCVIAAADQADEDLFSAVSHIAIRLCRLASLEVKVGAAKPAKSLSAVYYGAEAFLAVDGIVDLSNEKDRLEQEIQRLEKMSVGIEKKLQNEQFVANAPEDIVAYERDKLDNMRQSVVKLRRNIADLGL